MIIASVRILNLWKCGIVINPDSAEGRYFYNAPQTIPVWADPETYNPPVDVPTEGYTDIEAGDDEPQSVPAARDEVKYTHFSLREGIYKFLTLNKEVSEISFDEIGQYMDDDESHLEFEDVDIVYRTYEREDSLLRMPTRNWVDANPGYPYIQPGVKPVFFDTLQFHNIYKGGQENRVVFHPKRITQNIDIRITIGKNISPTLCKIDSAVIEISGIPLRMGAVTGHIKMGTTGKMAFWANVTDAYNRTEATLSGNIDVPTIVTPTAPDITGGPGFVQLVIYASAIDTEGNTKLKTIQCMINMYNALQQARLTQLTEDRQHAVKSRSHGIISLKPSRIKIDGEEIVKAADGIGGLPKYDDGGVVDTPEDSPIEI